jgi:hypothetical protein
MVRPMPALPTRLLARLHLAAMLAVAGVAALTSSRDAMAGDPKAPAQGAPAQGDALAQLRAVFAEGRALEDKGHWAEALEKFKEVAAGKMTPQVRFHIALCEENLGKLVSAMRGFQLAASEGTAAGSSAVEVPPAATQHAEALRARIAKLHIEVTGKLTTSKITLDDTPLIDKDFGAEVDVDPGRHVIEVRDASGKSTFRKELTLAEKGAEKVEVPVADAEEAPKTTPPPPSPSRVPAYATGAVGLAALAGSGVFFALRASNIATIASHCKDPVNYTGCQPGDQNLANQGKIYNGVADALLGVGIAGVATGTILFFVLGPKKQPAAGSPPPAASMRIVPAGTALKVIGTF